MHPYKVTVTIRDEKGALAYVQWYVQHDLVLYPANNAGNAVDDTVFNHVSDMLLILEPLISGQIVACAVTYTMPLGEMTGLALKPAPESGSDVEEGLRILYRSAGGSAQLTIPTIRENLLVGGRLDYLADVSVGTGPTIFYAGQFLDAFNAASLNTPLDSLQFTADARDTFPLTFVRDYQVFTPRRKFK